jgi:hypothetical protein
LNKKVRNSTDVADIDRPNGEGAQALSIFKRLRHICVAATAANRRQLARRPPLAGAASHAPGKLDIHRSQCHECSQQSVQSVLRQMNSNYTRVFPELQET